MRMILQPGKPKESTAESFGRAERCWYLESTDRTVFLLTFLFYFSLALKRRTSLDQTTLNQSVSVNGVHSDNDTSQVSVL